MCDIIEKKITDVCRVLDSNQIIYDIDLKCYL